MSVSQAISVQIELLEMRTEALLIEQTVGRNTVKDAGIVGEAHAWSRLFTKKYIKRTLIGVTMMFFQRRSFRSTNHMVSRSLTFHVAL